MKVNKKCYRVNNNFVHYPLYLLDKKSNIDRYDLKNGYSILFGYKPTSHFDMMVLGNLLSYAQVYGVNSFEISKLEIANSCGLSRKGKVYDRLDESLKRWAGVKAIFSECFREDSGEKVSKEFSIIDDYSLDCGIIWVKLNKKFLEACNANYRRIVSLDKFREFTPLEFRILEMISCIMYYNKEGIAKFSPADFAAKLPIASKYPSHLMIKVSKVKSKIVDALEKAEELGIKLNFALEEIKGKKYLFVYKVGINPVNDKYEETKDSSTKSLLASSAKTKTSPKSTNQEKQQQKVHVLSPPNEVAKKTVASKALPLPEKLEEVTPTNVVEKAKDVEIPKTNEPITKTPENGIANQTKQQQEKVDLRRKVEARKRAIALINKRREARKQHEQEKDEALKIHLADIVAPPQDKQKQPEPEYQETLPEKSYTNAEIKEWLKEHYSDDSIDTTSVVKAPAHDGSYESMAEYFPMLLLHYWNYRISKGEKPTSGWMSSMWRNKRKYTGPHNIMEQVKKRQEAERWKKRNEELYQKELQENLQAPKKQQQERERSTSGVCNAIRRGVISAEEIQVAIAIAMEKTPNNQFEYGEDTRQMWLMQKKILQKQFVALVSRELTALVNCKLNEDYQWSSVCSQNLLVVVDLSGEYESVGGTVASTIE